MTQGVAKSLTRSGSSDVWRRSHETTAGHSTVHRTGRFGIGLLAAFLLGSEIKVTTRSIYGSQDSAITFTCRQGDESIEVKPGTFHSGTRIEIEVSDAVFDALVKDYDDWDWYCLSSPRVRRVVVSDQQLDIPQRYTVPECDSSLDSTKWRRISADGYDDVVWSYEALSRWNAPDAVVVCNGIFVNRNSHGLIPAISPELNIIRAGSLSLVVFDPDGRFPINLQRDKVANGKTGFENPLALDVSDYFVTRVVETFEHLQPGITFENVQLSLRPNTSGLQRSNYRGDGLAFFILSKEGVIPVDAAIIREAGITSVLIDAANPSAGRGAFMSPTITTWADFYVAKDGITQSKVSRTEFIKDSIGGVNYYGKATGYFQPMGIVGRRLLIRKSDIAELVKPGNMTRAQWGKVSLEVDLDKWGLWSSGLTPELNLDLVAACADLDSTGSFGITLLYFEGGSKNIVAPAPAPAPVPAPEPEPEPELQPSPFAETWKRIVRSPILRQSPR